MHPQWCSGQVDAECCRGTQYENWNAEDTHEGVAECEKRTGGSSGFSIGCDQRRPLVKRTTKKLAGLNI